VDPAGFITYLNYDTGNNFPLLNIQQANRVTYFQDDGLASSPVPGQTNLPPRSSSRLHSSATRAYNRIHVGNHGFEVTDEYIGGSHTYYAYSSNAIATYFLAYQIDPNGQMTQFQPNALRFNKAAVRADNGVQYFQYASNNIDVVAKVGPRNSASMPQTTYYGYAAGTAGLRTRIRNPLNNTVYFGYDSRSRITQTLDPRQGATYFYYDRFSRNNVTLDALNNAAYWAYNANGRKIRQQDALGHTTYYTFDALDQQLSSQLPTGELTTF
jgi:YD repeat-containing protein